MKAARGGPVVLCVGEPRGSNKVLAMNVRKMLDVVEDAAV